MPRARAHDRSPGPPAARVCVVGPGTTFLSGVTYHTYGLSAALASQTDLRVSTVLVRRLLPRRWYPGATRVGADLSHLRLPANVARYDGVDWFWFPSILGALWFLYRHRPDVLIAAWWSAAAAHTILLLALATRALGGRVVVEMHETLDPGESVRPAVRWWGRRALSLLGRLTDVFVTHSEDHGRRLRAGIGADVAATVIPLSAWTHYHLGGDPPARDAPPEAVNVLSFGVIRPFKGVEDLIDAFERIPPEEIGKWWLTIVGETWEGCTEPAARVARSRYRHRISFVNTYVRDEDVDRYFRGADVVALPYRRSLGSGPLAVAMGYGKPVVVTSLPALREEADGYDGAVLVPPGDPDALLDGLRKAAAKVGEVFEAPRSWEATGGRVADLVRRVAAGDAPR
jgi:glycosyltransferase involved in cell wall biosynthesis